MVEWRTEWIDCWLLLTTVQL